MVRVSSEVEVSDEEDDQDIYSYDDSFIDDRINPTEASFQPETSRTDMMAIYRFLMNFYICLSLIFVLVFLCIFVLF